MYRGIVKGTGEFIHGDLISSKEAEYIHPHYNDSFLIRHDIASDIVMFEIEKKSHGQGVGFVDVSKVEMYEGDIIQDDRGLYWVIGKNRSAGMFWKYFLDSDYQIGDLSEGYPLADSRYIIPVYRIVGNIHTSSIDKFVEENKKNGIKYRKKLLKDNSPEPSLNIPDFIDLVSQFHEGGNSK